MIPIELPSLYGHQADQRDRTRTALAKHGRVIMCAPPGVGKTRMSKWILGASANREAGERQSGRSLFTVHRRGLVDNAIQSFEEEPGLPHGVIMSQRDTNYRCKIQVASIDSLLSWFIEDNEYRPEITFDLIVFDETHSHLNKLAKFLKYHDAKRETNGLHPAYVIGLTATPQANGLADIYKEIVPGPATQWLTDNEYLSPFRYFRATEGDLDKLVLRGGEFTQKSHDEAMGKLQGSDLFNDWKTFAEGRATVGFFRRRAEAKAAMRYLLDNDLRVEYVDGNTSDDERRKIFRWLNNHHIDYLCNVQVVERGTDIPRIGCVQVCVAVASLTRWRQMIGRGSRRHPAKTDCIVLDHGGNIKRGLGLFEDDPHWTLDITTKDPGECAPRPVIECPKCKALYRGGRCKYCGYEPTPPERKAQGLVFDGSELVEVKKEEKPKKEKTSEQLMISSLYRAGKSGKTWRQCVRIFKDASKKQCTDYEIPKFVTVAGNKYEMLGPDSLDGGMRVRDLYPFTVSRGDHSGPCWVPNSEATEAPY
jgi:superfamily II DNA or RNA helicase